MQQIVLSFLSCLLITFSAYASDNSNLKDEQPKPFALSSFPNKFSNDELAKLAVSQLQNGNTVYWIDPLSKDTFTRFYNSGSLLRYTWGGPAEYFTLKEVKDPLTATYTFNGAYYGQAEVQMNAGYDLFKLLNPSKSLTDKGFCLFTLYQWDDEFIKQKDDHRNNWHLVQLSFLIKALEDPEMFHLQRYEQDALGRTEFDKLLSRENMKQATMDQILEGNQQPIGKEMMLKFAHELKARLYEKLGVDAQILQQQVQKIGEANLLLKLMELLKAESPDS